MERVLSIKNMLIKQLQKKLNSIENQTSIPIYLDSLEQALKLVKYQQFLNED